MLCALIHLDVAHPLDLGQDSVFLLLKPLSFTASISFTSLDLKHVTVNICFVCICSGVYCVCCSVTLLTTIAGIERKEEAEGQRDGWGSRDTERIWIFEGLQ